MRVRLSGWTLDASSRPPDPLRDQRPGLHRRDRGRHRPRPGQAQAHDPRRPPPGRRPGFPPDQPGSALDQVKAGITSPRNLNTQRERTYPRVVKRGSHNTYRVKKPGDHGTRHKAPPTITLVNLAKPQAAA